MSNKSKMQYTNDKIRKFLDEKGFRGIYLFPHLRYQKDYEIKGCKFDAFGISKGIIWFFQFKTNCKPSKQILDKYREIESSSIFKCAWINRTYGKIDVYRTSPESFVPSSYV